MSSKISPLSLKFEVSSGCSIDEAAEESVRIANLFGVSIEFDFNGVRCMVSSGGEPKDLVRSYLKEASSSKKHKFAFV